MSIGSVSLFTAETSVDTEYCCAICTVIRQLYDGDLVYPVRIVSSVSNNITIEPSWWARIILKSTSETDITYNRILLLRGHS